MKALFRTILAAGLFAFAASSAQASIVKASINITNVTGDLSEIDPSLTSPASFIFSFTYDTNAADTDPDPQFGVYGDAVTSVELDFGIVKIVADVNRQAISLIVAAPSQKPSGDMLVPHLHGYYRIVGGVNDGKEFLRFGTSYFFRTSLEVLQSDALPTSFPPLVEAGDGPSPTDFSFDGEFCNESPCQTFNGERFRVQGTSDLASFSLSVVPEPATLGLFSFGLAGLGLAARRRTER